MTARYILRLDDACSTMLRTIWDPLEERLDELGIRPIVGVIPENKDVSMKCSPVDPEFWNRVRKWQLKGWNIALHGLHHVYHPIPMHAASLVPIHNKSEFVGLPLDIQRKMIRRAYAIFIAEGVRPDVFMAPSHTFDTNTLEALRLETDIRIITDGYALFPYKENEFTWIPQQLWRFRPLPFGTWTVALHPNTMSAAGVEELRLDLRRYKPHIISIESLFGGKLKRRRVINKVFYLAFMTALKVKQRKSRLLNLLTVFKPYSREGDET